MILCDDAELHLTCELWGRDPPAPAPAAADRLQRSSPRSSEDSPPGSSAGFCSSQRSRLTLLLCWHEFYSVDTSIHAWAVRVTHVLLYMLLSPSGESLSSLLLESILLSAHGNGPLLSYWLRTNITEYYVKKWMCIFNLNRKYIIIWQIHSCLEPFFLSIRHSLISACIRCINICTNTLSYIGFHEATITAKYERLFLFPTLIISHYSLPLLTCWPPGPLLRLYVIFSLSEERRSFSRKGLELSYNINTSDVDDEPLTNRDAREQVVLKQWRYVGRSNEMSHII